MASIFPGSASVGQIFDGYLFNGTAWDLIGNEFNPTTFSPNAPDNPKAGDLWVDSDSNVPSISNETILTIASASATYATKAELSNIDALPSQSGNTGKYLTTNGSAASWSTIDLTSAINTASAAAVAAIVDSAPATLDTLNELAAALNDDANFSSTVTTSIGNKLDISSASTTYLSKNEASSTYLTSASMQTIPVYVMNSGSSAQRPVSPTSGMFRFNTDSGYPEWYDSITSNWYNFYQGRSVTLEYLVIAGGGGGAGAGYRNTRGGGGGAGGYLTGSGFSFAKNTSYLVTVGAGGAGGPAGISSNATSGLNSVFSFLTAVGGGAGGAYSGFASESGGSGGGGGTGQTSGSLGTSGQGFAGGSGNSYADNGSTGGGGGGGSNGPGENGNVDGSGFGGDGGDGTLSIITGLSVIRAGGGGGGGGSGTGGAGSGGGGNGAGGSSGAGGNATANTGGGGGGANSIGESGDFVGGAGGSGVVILSYPSYYTISIGAGLTGATITVGENKVTTFTTGTGTVTFN